MTYRSLHSILKLGLDQAPPETIDATTHLPASHVNVRGAAYYAQSPALPLLLGVD
jgi:hypothetical protein